MAKTITHPKISAYLYFTVIILFVLIPAFSGCTASPPDTSAPQREIVERTADWQGALLYIADQDGPEPQWGSVRIYDNVSGFVENSIEQTFAAGPSDVYVTPDGSSMYVSSLLNGRVDKFRWDGKNWHRSGEVIDSPTRSLKTLVPGPDGKLYAADGAVGDAPAGFYLLDPETDLIATETLSFTSLQSVSGISWDADGKRAFISGTGSTGSSVLLSTSWPAGEVTGSVELAQGPVAEVITSPDGKRVFVMGEGGIKVVDTATLAVAATWNPAGTPGVFYYDAALSADGRFLFTAGTAPGSDSTLYVLSLADGSTVHSVNHISSRANGITRVE